MTTLERDVIAIVTNSNIPEYVRKTMNELWTKACKYEAMLMDLKDIQMNFEKL